MRPPRVQYERTGSSAAAAATTAATAVQSIAALARPLAPSGGARGRMWKLDTKAHLGAGPRCRRDSAGGKASRVGSLGPAGERTGGH